MRQLLDRVHRRTMFMLGRGRVNLVADDGLVQKHQLDLVPQGPSGALSVRDDTPRLSEFGFASSPPAGSDAIIACLAGDLSQAIIIATGHKGSRLKNLGSGDSALYDVRGAYVWLTPTGVIVDAAGQDVVIRNAANVTVTATTLIKLDAPLVEVEHDLKVKGNITDQSGTNTKTVADLRAAYDAHKHTGVTAGGALTGTTDHTV
ncbi:MAG: phage baseplate assembly protein V [Caulobacteraceae bacterium]